MTAYNHTPHDQDVLLAYDATNNPDTLYHHKVMAAPDRQEFLKSMALKLQGQVEMGVHSLKRKSKLEPGAAILPAVWAHRRKCRQTTGKVYKYKSRLNIGGHKMVEGCDYDLTYTPVASWPSVPTILAMVILQQWHVQQVDYVQAYPQGP
jgi:hypothetical protein